jgi:hypothetical protein
MDRSASFRIAQKMRIFFSFSLAPVLPVVWFTRAMVPGLKDVATC